MADQKSNLTPGGPIHEKPKGFPIFGSGARAEDQLRLLIESAKDYAIFTLDKDRKVTSWSSGAQTILGYTEEEIIGQSGDVIFIPEDRDINGPEEELKTAAEKGRAENERLHLRKDGSRFWGSGVTHPLRDEEGNLVGFVKIMRDLTTAKRLEEAKFFLASIVETSNDSVITIDFQRNITSWNKAAEYLYGYSAQEAIGKNLTMLTLPEDFAALLANVDAVEHSRQVVVFDTVRHKKDGQLIDLEIVMSPVLNTSGELVGISTIARDVSERKRREANLAFLAKINLGFAPLLTIEEVMEPVASQLADYLHLHRCHFSLIDEEADRVEVIYEYRRDESLPSIKWVQHISDKFTQEGRRHLSAGQLVVMDEVPDSPLVKGGAETLKALHFGSLVYLPHLEAGRWRFLFTAGRVERSQWRTDELELLQELSSKIYIRIERARAEEALRQSEERLQSITNLVPDLLWDSEPDGSTNWYNQRWLEYTGQSLEEAIGWGWMDAIHPDDRATSVRNYYKAVKNGEILRQEHRIRRHDGEYRWFIVSAYPSKNESGQLMKMYGAATDIHELRLVNAALRQSETRLRTLADVVPQVIWTNTSDGIADYFNQRWYEFTGLTYEQSKGPGWQTIVHPDDAPASIEKWKKALVAGEVFDTEYRLRRHDGIYCWFIGRNVPLKDGAGKIIGWFGSATDIENLKKTEAALSQSEAKLRITLESATDYAIITMDTNRKVEQWSQGATHLFGYTEEEVIGQTADTIFTEEDQEAGAQQHEMETARNTGRAADERWHRRKDGSRFFASGVMRSIVNNGVLTGYVKVLRDVTQQKLFTEELHRLVAERTVELQRSNEDLRQFAHVASHDLKEPIRKIQTFNNRILDEYANDLPPRVKTFSEKIGASADRMISMIEGVLRYSKLGNAEQVMEEVNLGEVIQQISTDLEVLIQQKDALVTTTNLPTLMANPTLMYQLFYNLILNSLKFAKEDEAPRINITSEKVQQREIDFVSITVSDNGIGFEQEFSQDIFKTFSRLHPAEDYEGTGLGLALCKKIVERHGGTITASGEPEKGATFTILLPLKTQ